MPLIITVPVSDIMKAPDHELILGVPGRCSRCGKSDAADFDTRRLKLMARPYKTSFNRVRFKYNHRYKVKLRVCSECRKADYVTHPEELKDDPTRLGRIARLQSVALTAGGTIAALGILLNTPLIPAIGFLTQIKQNWMYIAAVGLVVTLVIWFFQNLQQKQVLEGLNSSGYKMENHPRADIRTPFVEDETNQAAIALEVRIQDDDWAKTCAEHYGWKTHSDPD